MAERSAFQDPRLQDYVDDRLYARERAEVAAELEADPKLAADVEQIRRDGDLLRALAHDVLDEPVPERLRAVLRHQSPSATSEVPAAEPRGGEGALDRSWLSKAAAVVLLFASGVGAGWIANDFANSGPSAQEVILASVSQAFSFYDESDGYPLDFPVDRAEDFRSWIEQAFERDIEPPDLAEIGYDFEGGRLMPGGGVRVGAFQFSAPERGRLGVFFWPETEALPAPMSGRADPDVAYRVWSGNGFAIAVMGNEQNTDLDAVAETVFAFYQDIFGASS
jgi:anti-sigma factor RsiW